MHKSFLSVFGTLALAASTQGSAAVIVTKNLGTIGIGVHSYEFTDGPKSAGPLFTDTLTFTMGVAGIVKDYISDLDHIANGYKISLFDLTVSSVNPVFNCNGGCGTQQDFGSLIKGDSYKLTFDGTITGNPGTFAELEGKLCVTAVPEASTFAMMFAGLGLLGVAPLRRFRDRAGRAAA